MAKLTGSLKSHFAVRDESGKFVEPTKVNLSIDKIAQDLDLRQASSNGESRTELEPDTYEVVAFEAYEVTNRRGTKSKLYAIEMKNAKGDKCATTLGALLKKQQTIVESSTGTPVSRPAHAFYPEGTDGEHAKKLATVGTKITVKANKVIGKVAYFAPKLGTDEKTQIVENGKPVFERPVLRDSATFMEWEYTA